MAAACQVPELQEQYVDHLEGHQAEAVRNVEVYEDAAASFGDTLPEYIAEHLGSSEERFQETGRVIEGVVDRAEYLTSHLEQMANAGPFEELWISVSGGLDWDIAMETLGSFTPGLPVTLESAVYGSAGALLVGPAAYAGLKRGLGWAYGKIRGKSKEE